ncbi:3,4-dihydroxy-2-butanone 4-phosphate synthase [bacterium SM23_57]|nr:MAG: 3,4-dihydroxy-2-butanone 4-phosphate synthase [bacterium SM23_57]
MSTTEDTAQNNHLFDTIPQAIQDFCNGKILIVVDDEDRENEGDFIMAAEKITPENINFMAKYGRGMICTPITGRRAEELDLPLMVKDNTALHGTPFTVTIDAKQGTTTGISASDRALTVRKIADPDTRPKDFARPGHIFPLRAADGGVLRRAGHTEAVVDLATLAGLYPAGVLCEIMDEDGTMARVPRLREIADQFGLHLITIQDLIDYRRRHDKLVERVVDVNFPTKFGDFRLVHFREILTNQNHLAVVKGDVATTDPVLVRVHSQCLTGDIFGSLRCDCGDQLGNSMQMIEKEGRGVLLYMRQEGRGIGLANKLLAYHLQDNGKDTVEANIELGFQPDLRDYGIGAQILRDLGIRKIRLITNNPKKVIGLQGYNLEIVERVPIEVPATPKSFKYLQTKRDKMGHLIQLDDGEEKE